MTENQVKSLLEGLFSETPAEDAAETTRAEIPTLGLEERVRRRALRLEAAAEISSAATSILDLDKLLPLAVELIRERFNLYYVGIFLLDEAGANSDAQYATLKAATGRAGQQMMKEEHKLKMGGDSMIGWCVANAQARIAVDVAGAQPGEEAVRFDNPYLPKTRSEMALPLLSRGRVIGAMTIQSAQPAAFHHDDITVLQTMADQLANAIENARLFQERERRITELAIVNEIGQAMSTALGLDALLEVVHLQVSYLFDTTNFYVATYQEGSDLWTSAFHLEGGQQQTLASYSIEVGFTGYIIRTRQPLLFRTADEVLAFAKAQDSEVIGDMASSWLGIPLITSDTLVGVMAIQNYERENLYNEQDLTLFSTIAAQVANAMSNLRLLEETRRRAQEVEAINEVGRAITSVRDLDILLRQVVDTIKERFDHYFVGILLIEGKELVFRSGSLIGDSDLRWKRGDLRLALDGYGLNVIAATSGQPLLVNDVSTNEHYGTVEGLELVRAELDVPIEIRGRVIGTLTVQSDQTDAFDETDVALLQSLASQASVAIENAQLFAQAELAAQRSQALYETSRALSLQVETDPLMHTILEAVYQTLDCEHAEISVVDERAGVISAQHIIYQGRFDTFPEWIQMASYPLDHPDIVADVYRTGRTEIIGQWDERFNREIWEKYGHERYLRIFMPIQIHGRVLGVVEVGYDKEKKQSVSEDEVQLLTTFMDQAASALENAQLFEEVQSRADELATLNRMSRDLSATLDLESVIESIYQYTSQLMDTTSFYIAQYDPKTDQVWFPLAVEHGERVKWGSRRAGTGLTEHVIRSGEPLLAQENVASKLEELGVEAIGTIALSWLGVPMRIGNKVVGVITVQSYTTPRLYTEYHRDLLSAIANQAAVAAENARLFEEAQSRAERERILREITTRVRASTDTETIMRTAVRELGTALDRPTFVRLGDAEELARAPTATDGDNGHDATRGGE